jgi:hypothetical protein
MSRCFPSRWSNELEKKLSAEGIPDPVPRKLMDGIGKPSCDRLHTSEQNPFRSLNKRASLEKNLFLL